MELTEIYKQVFFACLRTSIYKKHDIGSQVEKWLPWMQAITEEMIQDNHYGLNGQEYEEASIWWNSILSDILEGMSQRDEVLLEDAVEFGIKEFLECFFSEEDLQRLRKESMDEQGVL